MKKNNLIIYSALFTTMLTGIAYAESERHIEKPINNTKESIKYSGDEPQGWDGVGVPSYIPPGDNPKWYDKSPPTYTEEGKLKKLTTTKEDIKKEDRK